jgi:hypothetical protein
MVLPVKIIPWPIFGPRDHSSYDHSILRNFQLREPRLLVFGIPKMPNLGIPKCHSPAFSSKDYFSPALCVSRFRDPCCKTSAPSNSWYPKYRNSPLGIFPDALITTTCPPTWMVPMMMVFRDSTTTTTLFTSLSNSWYANYPVVPQSSPRVLHRWTVLITSGLCKLQS